MPLFSNCSRRFVFVLLRHHSNGYVEFYAFPVDQVFSVTRVPASVLRLESYITGGKKFDGRLRRAQIEYFVFALEIPSVICC